MTPTRSLLAASLLLLTPSHAQPPLLNSQLITQNSKLNETAFPQPSTTHQPQATVQQPPPTPSATDHVKPQVTSVSLTSYDAEKVVFTVGLSVVSDRALTLDSIDVTQLRLNTLPVFASPLAGPIQLLPGKPWVPATPLTVTVYLRDIVSMQPLSDALQSSSVLIEGELFARVQLKLIERLAMREGSASVPVKLHEQVPLEVPGGALGKMSAQLLLTAADAALKQVRGPAQTLAGGLPQRVLAENAAAIVSIRSTYRIADTAAHTETEATWHGMGFFTGPRTLVTVAEALEPWAFDPELALALRDGRYTIVPNSLHLEATTGASPHTLQLGTDLTAAHLRGLKKHEIVEPRETGGVVKAQVAERAGPHNIAILTVTGPWTSTTPLAASSLQSPTTGPWPETIALRPAPSPTPTGPTLDPIQLPAALDSSRIKLGSLVDATVFGSPLLGPDGILGMVQDENSALPWPDLHKELPQN
jgi:hypothetical protein